MILTHEEIVFLDVYCHEGTAPDEEMTPERVADILLAQEVECVRSARLAPVHFGR